MTKKKKGFTVIEILITLVVVGALAGVAMAGYSSYLEKSRRKEAVANLQSIYLAQKNFILKNNFYFPGGYAETDLTNINMGLGLDLVSANFDLTVESNAEAGAAATFIATATPNDGSSLLPLSITQNGGGSEAVSADIEPSSPPSDAPSDAPSSAPTGD